MAMGWTPAQRAAIEDRGGTLLVSAAAGSGKTAVLVERAVQLICDESAPVSADRLLIVTFTRAAAQELRARIAVRLTEEMAKRPGDAWLRRQKLLLGRADIGTIDAFCMQLLKRYFAKLDLPPDFTLAEDALSHSLRQSALAQTMEEMYEDADFAAFASLYGKARTDDFAASSVLAFYDFLRTLPSPHAAMEKFCRQYESDEPLGSTLWGKTLLSHAANAVDSAMAILKNAAALCREDEVLTKSYLPALEDDMAFVIALKALIDQGRWDSASVQAQSYKAASLRAAKGADEGIKEAVQTLRKEVKGILSGLQEGVFFCTEEEFCADRARIAPLLRALARAVKRFEALFYQAKMEEKALEYSDFEHLALRLLCDENGGKTAIARQAAARYDAVMVDEYQDTNTIQAQLYRCLANEDESNLFFVGDVKQSIYRFRMADPRSFLQKKDAFAPYQPNGAHPMTITLANNFRSAENVIGAINDVFRTIMSRAVGGVAYEGDEALHAGIRDGYDGGPMEVLLAEDGDSDESGDAQMIARRIVHMVREGFLVREKGGTTRPCNFGDFCILLRTRSHFTAYETAMTLCGVPACADAGEDPISSTEAAPLLCLLRVIDNPAKDVALAGAMLSPMFGFLPDDLAALRLSCPDTSLYGALLQSEDEKMQRFAALLHTLRRLAATEPVDILCEEILARTHYFAAVGAMENGTARRENLRAFTAFARTAGENGLAAFLRMVDHVLESGAPVASAPPVLAQGSVSIMTIHRSKGLEFPVVFLAQCERKFYMRDAYDPVVFHAELGVGLNLREEGGLFSTVPQRAVCLLQKQETISEEMRILYVALTRARDKLFVSAAVKSPESYLSKLALRLEGQGGAVPYLTQNASCFADWLCMAALLHPDAHSLRKCAGAAGLPLIAAEGSITASFSESQDGQEALPVQELQSRAEPDKELYETLMRSFAAKYPDEALASLPVKLSVSELTHGGYAEQLQRPAFLQKEKMTAAERGTAMHAVLQFASFERAREDLNAELERLREGGWLTEHTVRHADRGALEAFLHSAVCKRMCSAKKLLREYAFFTAVPAKYVQADLDERFAMRPVAVQGIADAVLVFEDGVEIVDYKTDHVRDGEILREKYRRQLLLYRAALEKKLSLPVNKCTIYSLYLSQEIDVPLE